jgi:hypothetical protein
MVREVLSLPGFFLFFSGIALGIIVQFVPRKDSEPTRRSVSPAWKNPTRAETARTRTDSDAAFRAQLANLYVALLQSHSARLNEPQVRAKNPAAELDVAFAERGAWLKF